MTMASETTARETQLCPPDTYQYQSISDEYGVVRLFYTSRSDSGIISCNFVHGDLRLDEVLNGNGDERQEQWTCDLDYYAISYTWGTGDRSCVIEVDGRLFTVTPNLFAVLEDMCIKHPDSLFWADAICIDQGNHAEKSHQVRQMPHIYEAAVQVFIYLSRVGADVELEGTMTVVKHFDSFTRGEYWASDNPLWPIKWEMSLAKAQIASGQPTIESGKLTACVERLFSHSWFTRAWIIQEVAKSRSARVFIAPHNISSRAFALLPRVAKATVTKHVQAVLDVMPGPARQSSWWREDRSLGNLLVRFCEAKATIEMDKIYALLGICSDGDVHINLQPDYGKEEHHVVQDVIAHLCKIPPVSVKGLELGCSDLLWGLAQNYRFTSGTYQARGHAQRPEDPRRPLLVDGVIMIKPSEYDVLGSIRSGQKDQDYGMGQDPESTRTDLLRLLDDVALAGAFQTTDQRGHIVSMLDWHHEYATVDNIGGIMWSRWSQMESTGEGTDIPTSLGRTRIILGQRRISRRLILSQRPTHHRLRMWMGHACFDLLHLALRHSLSEVPVDARPAEDPLAMILRQANDVASTVQLLRNSSLMHFIPGSAVLVDALWLNRDHGLHILEGVLRGISETSRRAPNNEQTPRRPIADFELLNIWRRFEDLHVLSYFGNELRPGLDNPITVTARSLSVLLPGDEPEEVDRLVYRLSRTSSALPPVDFSWGGIFGLLTRCRLSDLRFLIAASTATAEVVRRLIPSLVARRLESTELADIARCLIMEEMRTRGHVILLEGDETRVMAAFGNQICLSGFSRGVLDVEDRMSSWTALTAAAALGDAAEVQRLVLSGEPLHAVDGYGLTALTWAIWSNQTEIVDMLTQAEARIYSRADEEEQSTWSTMVDATTLDHVRMLISRRQDTQRHAFNSEETFLEFMVETGSVQPWVRGRAQVLVSQCRGYRGWSEGFQELASRHDDLELPWPVASAL